MKKFISGLIVGMVITLGLGSFAAVFTFKATPAPFKIFLNGKEFKPSNQAAVIDARTYLPLRDIGEALGVKVNWNNVKKQVEIGEPPTDEPSPTATPMPTPSLTLGKNQFLSRYNAGRPYDFKITVLGKVGEDLTKSVPHEFWLFRFENVRDCTVELRNTAIGWNQGTTITTVAVPEGYKPIGVRKLKPGEIFEGCAALGITEKKEQIQIGYDAGGIVYEP